MKPYAQLLQTRLTDLPFSPACLRWFSSAGVYTVEDTEDDITLLLQSPYYKQELLHEMTRVITNYMTEGKLTDNNKSEPEMKTTQQLLDRMKKNNDLLYKLVQLLTKRKRRKTDS